MTLQLAEQLNSRTLFSPDNLKKLHKFEASKGTTIDQIPLSKMLKFSNGKVESVGVEPTLISQKVIANVIQAEQYVPLWNKVSRVRPMTAPKEEQPVIAYSDFKVYKGTHGAKVRKSGGFFAGIELDCSKQKGLHRVSVSMPYSWIKQNQWSAVEEALTAAGQAMYDEVLGTIITELEADKDSTMTDTMNDWGNDQYKSLVKMVTLLAAKKVVADIILVNPTEVYDIAVLDYFIRSNYTALAGKTQFEPLSGLVGYLMPNRGIPIYWSNKVTSGTMICASKNLASVLGIYQDLTLRDFDDVLNGEEGAVLEMQWDVKTGKDAKPAHNVKYSWATVTAA